MSSLKWSGFVGLWLSRMEISEGVEGVQTGIDTSRTKFFILTNGQLISSPTTNENRSDQNRPITACAVGPDWGATAFLGASNLFTGQNLGKSCGKGEEGLMLFHQDCGSSTHQQFESQPLWSWVWLSPFLCLRTKAVDAGATMFPGAFSVYLFKAWRTEVVS